jgi:hypothetical protein
MPIPRYFIMALITVLCIAIISLYAIETRLFQPQNQFRFETIVIPSPQLSSNVSNNNSKFGFQGSRYATTLIEETGLPTGVIWNVTFWNSINSSASNQISFNTSVGSYKFVIPAIKIGTCLYRPSSYSGNMTAGSNMIVSFSTGCPQVISAKPSGA